MSDPLVSDLYEIIARASGLSVEQLRIDIARQRAKREARVRTNNARFDAALERITDIQQVVIDRLEREGYRANSRIWIDARSRNIARTFSKRVWDTRKGAMGTKLVTVYPDGTRNETFEKRITIRKSF